MISLPVTKIFDDVTSNGDTTIEKSTSTHVLMQSPVIPLPSTSINAPDHERPEKGNSSIVTNGDSFSSARSKD